MRVVIVGGVAGGASCAARLRRLDENAEIILLEKGRDISYANCGLPYFIGGVIKSRDELHVQTATGFAQRFAVDVRTRHEVLGVEPAAKTLLVKDIEGLQEYTLHYDKLLLSPGARPFVPPVPGVGLPGVFTLRTLGDTFAIDEYIRQNAPGSAVVVGGGFIGLEMVENLRERGLKVTLVEGAAQLLPALDTEMAATLCDYLQEQNVPVHLGRALKGIRAEDGQLWLDLADTNTALCADMVLLSMGVRPDTAFLQNSGLAMDARGALLVDETLRTNAEDVFAVGDAVAAPHFVTGTQAPVQLAGPANRQGRVAADNIAGLHSRYGGAQGSSILKLFSLQAAATGLTEKAAIAAGYRCDKVYITAASHAGYYPGGHNLVMKLVFETPGGRILGAQVLGFDGADKRCDVIATAMRAGLRAPQLAELELCYAPPFSSAKDPVNMLGYVAENVLTGKVKQYFWQDMDSLPKDGSVTFLDVRGGGEVEKSGILAGAVHIPLPQLRQRLDELDKAKPVYVTCQSGLRSYIACRILSAHGFDCYNFAGGWGLYKKLYD